MFLMHGPQWRTVHFGHRAKLKLTLPFDPLAPYRCTIENYSLSLPAEQLFSYSMFYVWLEICLASPNIIPAL